VLTYDPEQVNLIMTDPNTIEQMNMSRGLASMSPLMVNTPHLIEFYGALKRNTNDRCGKWFSNCVRVKCTIDGVDYPSSEHYFQMQKFNITIDDPTIDTWCSIHGGSIANQLTANMHVRDQMMTMGPKEVAGFGRGCRTAPIRGDWETSKYVFMFKALVAKFTQNPEFAQALKDTKDAVLVERAPRDTCWAIDNQGVGMNMLGILLMLVRKLL
jgi:ribA/ribD-fused uncharacterized protein